MKALVLLTALSLLSRAPCLAQETPSSPTVAPHVQTVTDNTNDTSSIIGTWAISSSNQSKDAVNNGIQGYIKRQYTFNTNGTYIFIMKNFQYNSDKLILIKESGTFKIDGNKIVVDPNKSVTGVWSKDSVTASNGNASAIDKWGKLLSSKNNLLEKTTYTFTKHYFSGIQQWNLVLQADRSTERDGPYSANTTFENAWYYAGISSNNPVIEIPSEQQQVISETNNETEKPKSQEASPATARDFFLFSKALKVLRQGQLSSTVTMDIQGENLAVVLKGQLTLTHKLSGSFVSEMTVTPPMGGKPKRYKVTHDGKTTWVQDLGARTYALQPVTEENEFLVRGLLTGLAKTALEKLDAEQLKLLDTPEPSPELAAELEKAVREGDGSLKVRDETVGGKSYRVYDLQPGKEKGVISIYVTSGHRPERLSMVLDQAKLKIKFTEVISRILPGIPEGTSFKFMPTPEIKKVKAIDLGSF